MMTDHTGCACCADCVSSVDYVDFVDYSLRRHACQNEALWQDLGVFNLEDGPSFAVRAPSASTVEVELHLVRVGAVADLIVFLVQLEGNPALDQILGKDLFSQQEVVVLFQRVESTLQGVW